MFFVHFNSPIILYLLFVAGYAPCYAALDILAKPTVVVPMFPEHTRSFRHSAQHTNSSESESSRPNNHRQTTPSCSSRFVNCHVIRPFPRGYLAWQQRWHTPSVSVYMIIMVKSITWTCSCRDLLSHIPTLLFCLMVLPRTLPLSCSCSTRK